MIFHKSLSKKKGTAYSFFSGLSSGFVPAVLMCLVQTLLMAVIPLINFIEINYGNTSANWSEKSANAKDTYKFFVYGLNETATLYIIFGVLGIISILVAVRLFSFICDKKTVNVFYSLGIKRSSLFISKYFAGAVLLCAANIIPVILSYAVNLIFLGASWQLSLVLLHLYCGFSVFSLICYSVAAVVFSSVGTVSEAVVYSVALLFAPTIIIFITDCIAGAFLPSSTYDIYVQSFSSMEYDYTSGMSLLDATASYNPLLFFTEEAKVFSKGCITDGAVYLIGTDDNMEWHFPNIFIHFPWFTVAVAFGCLGALLFRRIKAENCGFLNTNKILSNLMIFELCFFGSCIMLSEMRWTETYIVLGIGALAAFGLYIIAEIFLKRNFIKILKSLYKFAAHMAVIALIFGICATGAFGYSTYIPDKSKVASVEIALPFSYSQITTKDSTSGYNSDGFIRVYESYRYTFMPVMEETEDIDKIIELNRKINDNENDDGSFCEIIIRYNYKNGNYSERKHTLTTKEEIASLFAVFDTKACKNELKTLFYDFGGIDAIKDAYAYYGYVGEPLFMRLAFTYDYSVVTARTGTLQENRALDLTKEEFTALKDAVYKDLLTQTSEEYYTASEKQLGVLSFGISQEARQIEGINGYSQNNIVFEEEVSSPTPPDAVNPEEDYYEEEYPQEETDEVLPEDTGYLYTDSIPYEGLGGLDYYSTYDVIVTENMANTLSVLKNLGIEDCFKTDLTIESVSFREYSTDLIFNYYYNYDTNYINDFFAYPTYQDYYADNEQYMIEDNQAENKITDKEKLSELDSLMKLHEYTFNSGYFCLVKYTNGTYTVKYLSQEDAPEYVKNYTYVMNGSYDYYYYY